MNQPLRVLLIEDSEDDALLVTRELRRSGYAVEMARVETPEAMAAELDRRAWDVVIADYSLPRFSAEAALRLLRERGLDLPFIIVSGVVGEEMAVAAMRAGAHDFIVKGNWARLAPAIERERQEMVNRRERARADRALHLLAAVSRDLTGSLDYETTLQRVAWLGVPDLADWCVLDLVDDHGALHRAALASRDFSSPEIAEQLSTIPAPDRNADGPIARALRSAQAQLVASPNEDECREIAQGAEHLGLLRAMPLCSFIAAPLLARGRVLGVLGFALVGDARCYESADRSLAEELAGRAALAIDNARLYEAERRARSQAEHAVKLRDEFLSIAAHELKTPITSLRASAQLMLRRMARRHELDPEQVARAFELIDHQSDKLAQLVGQLLDISRIESGRLALDRSPTDVARLVAGVAEAARNLTERHTIVVRSPAELTAMVDPLRLEQVVANLIDNAIKYSPAGGEVEVDVSLSPGDELRIAVTDHGIGIPPERRAHIFDRFYQAHAEPSLGGLGLGLYISQQIVQLHRGTLVVEFPTKGGTRFIVQVPRRAPEIERNYEGSAGADRRR